MGAKTVSDKTNGFERMQTPPPDKTRHLAHTMLQWYVVSRDMRHMLPNVVHAIVQATSDDITERNARVDKRAGHNIQDAGATHTAETEPIANNKWTRASNPGIENAQKRTALENSMV